MTGRPPLPIGTHGEISWSRRGNSWRAFARYRGNDGVTKTIARSGPTKSSSSRALRAAVAEAVHVADSAVIDRNSRLIDVAAIWMRDMELTDSPRIQVRQRYVKDWDTIVRPGLGELRLRELTVSRISTFLHAQAALTERGSRMRQSRTVLSLILAKAVRYDAIDYNPVQRLDKFARPPKLEVRTLDLEQIAAIRSAADYYRTSPRTYGPKPDPAIPRIIEVMIGTGLRISELLALRKCDVDLMSSPPRLSVRGSLVQLDGVGLVRQPFTKSAAGMRDLPLPEFVAQAIREQLVAIANDEPESPLFPSQKRTFRSPANVRRTMRGIRDAAASVPDWIDISAVTPHSFRRTAATALKSNADAELAADQLGHSGTRVTEEHYIAKNRIVDERVAEILERNFGKGG